MNDDLSGLLVAWICGDVTAVGPLADYCEEFAVNIHPFEVGRAYFFEQQTLYYVGRVVEVGPCWVRLAYGGREITGVHHKYLLDLRYAVEAAIRQARAKVPDEMKD